MDKKAQIRELHALRIELLSSITKDNVDDYYSVTVPIAEAIAVEIKCLERELNESK